MMHEKGKDQKTRHRFVVHQHHLMRRGLSHGCSTLRHHLSLRGRVCVGQLVVMGFGGIMARDWRREANAVWPILVECASRRETMTYGALGKQIGVNALSVRLPLDHIARYCAARAKPPLPPLTIVVVNGDTGKPGEGIVGTTPERFTEDLTRVHDFPWGTVPNPFRVFAATT